MLCKQFTKKQTATLHLNTQGYPGVNEKLQVVAQIQFLETPQR